MPNKNSAAGADASAGAGAAAKPLADDRAASLCLNIQVHLAGPAVRESTAHVQPLTLNNASTPSPSPSPSDSEETLVARLCPLAEDGIRVVRVLSPLLIPWLSVFLPNLRT